MFGSWGHPTDFSPSKNRKSIIMRNLAVVALTVGLTAVASFETNDSRTWEFMLPCRDGIELHTRVALPRNDEGQKFTTVMDRSPYGYTGLEWMADFFLPWFATVGQDFRGTQTSEGKFTIWHMDANDSEDLGNWIVQQPWSNGKIFTFGASADGLGAFTTVQNQPAWLSAQYFIWTSSIGYDVFFPQGAMVYELIDSWIHGTVDGDWADVCYEDIIKNEMKTEWWDAVELTNHYEELIHFPAAFWAGWYDIFLVGNMAAYHGYNYEADPKVRNQAKILVDPLGHCQGGAEYFPQDLIAGRTALGLMQAYELYGIRPVARTDVKNVTFYVMSSNDEAGLSTANYWTSLDAFPTPKMTHYYAHADGSATTSKPTDTEADHTGYVYDPKDPVPTVGGSNLDMPCGPLDQKDIDQRSDVLVFQTPVQDEALFMTGPLFANLFVGSDAIDTDFMVRISDVYPTGEVRLIQDSAIRMRWREGGLTPVYMEPNQVYEVHASVWNTSYAIAPGHALRFVVTSSNYPRFSLNPNNGELLIQNSTSSQLIVANNVLYHSAQYPSSVVLPIVQKHAMPELHNIKMQFQKAYPDIDLDAFLKVHPDFFGEIVERKKANRIAQKKAQAAKKAIKN